MVPIQYTHTTLHKLKHENNKIKYISKGTTNSAVKKHQYTWMPLTSFYSPMVFRDSWDPILLFLRRSAIMKASSRD